ncbi:hypothetical protein [Alsobacter soli]|nr:hypothetical protein [Alsobacter soli]
MQILLVILGGVALLGLCLVAGGLFGPGGSFGMRRASLIFVPLWLIAALLYWWISATWGGRTAADEFPFVLIIFAAPALAALGVWWRMGRKPA